MKLANASNGLAYPHDDISMFLSTHAHNRKMGYFRIDAMPYKAVRELLIGNSITLIDATQHNKPMPDSFKFGVTTWCMVFNRAIKMKVKVCDWETEHMASAAQDAIHKKLVQRIRRLSSIYGVTKPAVIGNNVLLEIHKNINFDDKPELLKEAIMSDRWTPRD